MPSGFGRGFGGLRMGGVPFGGLPFGMSAGGITFPLTNAEDDLVTHWRTWGDPITDYVTKAGDESVNTLIDQSGEGNNWVQDNGANQPFWSDAAADKINGHEVVEFTTNEYITCDALGALLTGADKPFTVFIVFRKDLNNANHFLFSLGSSISDDPRHDLHTNNVPNYRLYRRGNVIPPALDNSAGTPDTNPHYLSHVFTGTTAGLWEDGVEIIAPATDYDANTLTVDQFTIGALRRTGLDNYLEGDIVEFALCTKALSDARRLAVEAYFASQYGI